MILRFRRMRVLLSPMSEPGAVLPQRNTVHTALSGNASTETVKKFRVSVVHCTHEVQYLLWPSCCYGVWVL